jgi:dCMP deaminase
MRASFDERMLRHAEFIAKENSTCPSPKGAVITVDKVIQGTGFNDMPMGVSNCGEAKVCACFDPTRKSGERLHECYAVHAEANAVVFTGRNRAKGGTIYCTHQPCVECAKLIIQAGIKRVVFRHRYPSDLSLQWFEKAGVTWEHMPTSEFTFPGEGAS